MQPALILDVDGTVWRAGELVPGAGEAIARLRKMGYRLLYLSNNPLPRSSYAARLRALGLPTADQEVLTAYDVLERCLLELAPGCTIYVLAYDELQGRLARRFSMSDKPEAIDLVLATAPVDLTYDRLTIAYQALQRGARFWATNADPRIVNREGGEVPHTGAVIGALHGCTGRQVEVMTGKPSLHSARAALERLGIRSDQGLIVGDSLETDIALGRAAGIRTVLVLSGVTRPEALAASPIQPDHVLSALADLPAWLERTFSHPRKGA